MSLLFARFSRLVLLPFCLFLALIEMLGLAFNVTNIIAEKLLICLSSNQLNKAGFTYKIAFGKFNSSQSLFFVSITDDRCLHEQDGWTRMLAGVTRIPAMFRD